MKFLAVVFAVVAVGLVGTLLNTYVFARHEKWVREVLNSWAGPLCYRVTDLEEASSIDQMLHRPDCFANVWIVWLTDEQGDQRRARAVIGGPWFTRFNITWVD